MDCFIAAVLMVIDPPIEDRYRFPSKEVASRAMQFNRAYRRHVELRQVWELHNWWYWQEAKNETDYIYRCWDYLHAAQGGEGGDGSYHRRSLKRLSDLLYPEYYYLGKMPPPAPIWRFQTIEGFIPDPAPPKTSPKTKKVSGRYGSDLVPNGLFHWAHFFIMYLQKEENKLYC